MSNAGPAALVQERINRLLTEVDPKNTKPEEFFGHRYELGLAWVHFPEGGGGLGIAPGFQRQVDEQLARAGAPPGGQPAVWPNGSSVSPGTCGVDKDLPWSRIPR